VSTPTTTGESPRPARPAQARVALARGEAHYGNVRAALNLIADQVDLQGRQRILIKPNFVSTMHQLAATHVDAVRAVLDFLRTRTAAPIVIAEGAALSDTFDGFRNFGYLPLVEAYGVELCDLNRDDFLPVAVYDRHLQPQYLRLASRVVESDFRISVGPPKTHDAVIVTLSLKNMVMGSLISDHANGGSTLGVLRWAADIVPQPIKQSPFYENMKGRVASRSGSDKMAMHQGYPVLNLNLAKVALLVAPHLAVIDGFTGMEGEGPNFGDPVDWRVAVASTDFLAADVLTAWLMGFAPTDIGYLVYAGQLGLGVSNLEAIEVVGARPEDCRRPFRPHPTMDEQRRWRSAAVERLL
jgi:uncharacterized protein (DUF362 family)